MSPQFLDLESEHGVKYTVQVPDDFDWAKATDEERQAILDRARVESQPLGVTDE